MMEDREYTSGGISFTLIRKKIKNVHLRVVENAKKDDAKVIVTAPLRTPISFILQFVADHEAWICSQKQAVLQRIRQNPMKGSDLGKDFPYLGQNYALLVSKGNKNTLILSDEASGAGECAKEAYLTVKNPEDIEACHKFIYGWLKSRLQKLIGERLLYWEERMGLQSSGFQIRDMRSRWGSCNVKTKNLHFNLQLIYQPMEFVDYVIVHELAHIREASHSPRFWTIVEMYIPDWKRLSSKSI